MTDRQAIKMTVRVNLNYCLSWYKNKYELGIKKCTTCKYRKYKDCFIRKLTKEIMTTIPHLNCVKKTINKEI